jgi:hypothetical protein
VLQVDIKLNSRPLPVVCDYSNHKASTIFHIGFLFLQLKRLFPIFILPNHINLCHAMATKHLDGGDTE